SSSMRAEHAPNVAAQIRAMVPAGASVADDVAAILADVQRRGDEAVREHEGRFGEARERFKVPDEELDAALAALDPAVREGLEVAIHNVRAVAQAGLDEERLVTLPQGQTVKLREIPVRRAAVY